MSKIPDRLNIDKDDRKLYDKLDEEEMLRAKGGRRTRKEQFLFAMAIGFKNMVKRPLELKEGFFLSKDLRPEDEALMNAVALYDADSQQVLANKEEVFRIAEEYAHAGIRLLAERIGSTSFGSFEKEFEKDLYDTCIKAKLG